MCVMGLYLVIYFFGLTESMLAEKLSHLIDQQTDPSMAVYASSGLLSVRLTTGKDGQEAQRLLDSAEEAILNQ